jgi:hypothetical protein
MKQYLLLVLTIIISFYAIGQEDALIIKESTKINRQLIPGPVMDSLHQLFPKAMPIEYYSMSPASAKNAWAVAGADSLVSYHDSTDYYLIVIKKAGIKFYSLFSASGVLIMTKLKENVTVLPGTVQESMKEIRKDYPGFKVRSADCYKNEDRARQLYYEVIAERGNNQQRFFYDEGGTLVKIDIIRRETN